MVIGILIQAHRVCTKQIDTWSISSIVPSMLGKMPNGGPLVSKCQGQAVYRKWGSIGSDYQAKDKIYRFAYIKERNIGIYQKTIGFLISVHNFGKVF